jgi:hypothetical protein
MDIMQKVGEKDRGGIPYILKTVRDELNKYIIKLYY